MKMQLKDIINPKYTDIKHQFLLPEEKCLDDIHLEDIPDTAVRVCAIDNNKNCIGSIDVDRLKNVLSLLKKIHLEFVLDELEDAIIAVDEFGTIFYVNAAYTKILGVPAGKIVGKDLHIVENNAGLLDVLSTGRVVVSKKQFVKSVGRFVALKMFPIMKDGAIIGAVSVFRDTTEENRLNTELQRVSQVAAEYSHRIEYENILKKNNIIGESVAMAKCIFKATSAAATDVTILMLGENGTGKEVFTRLIHQNSARKDKPFIAMNCAAIPENLVESELFGYEGGSFTGAKKSGQLGKIQLAEGGTLFLDEIGDMPLPMQAKLLRVLQEGEIDKIGRQNSIKVNFRLIAATNQPLEKLIEEGRFRQDLFYRLNVVSIEVPPLRERGHDVFLLAVQYLEVYNEKYKKQVHMTEEVYQEFQRYNWPGNVRELQNVIESCVVLCSQDVIELHDLPDCFKQLHEKLDGNKSGKLYLEDGAPERLDDAVEYYEKIVIQNALEKCKYNRKDTIEMLGISRRSFYRKVEQLHISLER